MAASPETDAPPESADMNPSPPPPSSPVPRPAQESPSLTAAAPPEMTHLDQAAPIPPPPPEQDMEEHSKSAESPTPVDGGDPRPSLPQPKAAPSASPALKAASPEKPASSSPYPEDAPVEGSPDVSASATSSPPSPQIGEASPEDAPPPLSPPPTPPASTSPRAVPDSSTTQAPVVMESEEAAPPRGALKSDSNTVLAPLTPLLESGPKGLALQPQPRPPALEMALQVCQNPEHAQPPPPPAESPNALPDAAAVEVVAVASEIAAGSPPALEATDGKTNTAPGVPLDLESGSEGMLTQQQPQPPHQEMASVRCKNSEPTELPLLSPPLAESTYDLLEAAAKEIATVASEETAGSPTPVHSEASGSQPALVTTGGEAALESRSEGPVQEPMQTSPKMEAEPCSPDMAPPGFDNFKSKWLPLPASTQPVASMHPLLEAPVADAMDVMPDAAAASMDVDMDISPGQLPLSKRAEEGPLQQALQVSSSQTMDAAPCSPHKPTLGFENFKPSWLLQPALPPLARTIYSPDVATTPKEVAVTFVDKVSSVSAGETTDIAADTTRNLLPTLDSGAGGSLQVSLPSSPSPAMAVTPCSPPGFENVTSPQLRSTSPVVQTSYISQDPAGTRAVCVTSENASQPSPAFEAMDVGMDTAPALPASLESVAGESMRQEPLRLPSCTAEGKACSLEMVPSGSDNLEALQLLPLVQTPDTLAEAVITTVTVEAVAEAKEEEKGPILPLEKRCEDSLQCLEPKPSSPVAQAAPSSPMVTPTGLESSESSQPTSPRIAERIDPPSHVPATGSATVKSEKTAQPLSPLQATDKDMESAPVLQSPLKSEERPLPQSQHQPSSPSGKDVPCSPDNAPPGFENFDSLEELPPPPPLCTNFEMGQMVCGCCRDLIAYPKGAVHVQCYGCWTINLVLEAHEVGKVYCGKCETLLMYPFGAPSVRCSTCLFVTEIGERNIRPRISTEQGASPRLQELTHPS